MLRPLGVIKIATGLVKDATNLLDLQTSPCDIVTFAHWSNSGIEAIWSLVDICLVSYQIRL